MPEPVSPSLPTNTLTVTNLDNHHFESLETMQKLRTVAESFGSVYYFAPIKTFHRVFIVYNSTFDAQRAKTELHNTAFEDTSIRVYYGQHTDISIDPAKYYLQTPELEKNWLISPPGSPPVGWSQVREDPPNAHHLADDLVKALLAMNQPLYQLPRADGSKPGFADLAAEIEEFSLDDSHIAEQEETKETVVRPLETAAGRQSPTGQQQQSPSQTSPQQQSPMSQPRPQQGAKSLPFLKIDTNKPSLTLATSSSSIRSSSPGSPLSAYPQTPIALAFSPAVDTGDQPFITIQDWGVDNPAPAPKGLTRRGTIPKTQFPSGPISHTPMPIVH